MKYTYFILYKEVSSAEELVYTISQTVITTHRVFHYIIIDQTKVYTSKFWKSLMLKIEIDQRHSMGYHLQIDGMIKRLNQTLKQYLQIFVNQN
jgi:protein associated with RNAse G/E